MAPKKRDRDLNTPHALPRRTQTPAAAIDAGIVLMRLAGQRAALEDQVHSQVLKVLDSGGSWTTVAVALGTSKQAAHERYHRRKPFIDSFEIYEPEPDQPTT